MAASGRHVRTAHVSLASRVGRLVLFNALTLWSPITARAQQPVTLATLLRDADSASPALRAARARLAAARARIEPSATRPDPTLQAGFLNLPITRPNLRDDEMTMSMIGISQSFPAAGRLSQRRRVATADAESAAAEYASTRLSVHAAIEGLYFELLFVDASRPLVEQQRDALSGIVRATDARYAAGEAPQHELLTARIAAQRIAESALIVREQQRTLTARLNAHLNRDDSVSLTLAATEIVSRVADPAVTNARYADTTLGSRVADSPLLSLDSLQRLAATRSPVLMSQKAMIRAQAARVQLAQAAGAPDIDVSLQYGNRLGRRDMMTAMVAIPLHVQRARNLTPQRIAAQADLDALTAEHDALQAQLRADVTTLTSDAERARAQTALYAQSILPQARAAVASALTSYQASRTELATVLSAQSAVLTYEMSLLRSRIDVAIALSRLRQTVGAEVLR